jgi:hypothetical protein
MGVVAKHKITGEQKYYSSVHRCAEDLHIDYRRVKKYLDNPGLDKLLGEEVHLEMDVAAHLVKTFKGCPWKFYREYPAKVFIKPAGSDSFDAYRSHYEAIKAMGVCNYTYYKARAEASNLGDFAEVNLKGSDGTLWVVQFPVIKAN